jgi:hypothetical protein
MAEALKQQRALARRMSVDSDAHVKHEAPVFVASEFWDQQPRRAAEQMMARNLPKYIAFFGDGAFTPLEEASDLVSQAAWFKRYLGPFQPVGGSDRQQAMDICKVLTYERVERGGELFAKGEQVGAFAVVLSGAVRLSGDPRNREDVIKTGGEAFGRFPLRRKRMRTVRPAPAPRPTASARSWCSAERPTCGASGCKNSGRCACVQTCSRGSRC